MITPSSIIRCLKYDGHSAESGAAYCRKIATAARFNPWACPGDAEAYDEAARRLEVEAEEGRKAHAAANMERAIELSLMSQ